MRHRLKSVPLLRLSAGEGRGETQRDEGATGDVALGATEADAGAEMVGHGAGEDRPHRIADPTHESKQDSQLENLQAGMAEGWVHKLGQEGKKEQGGLRIEEVDQDALSENTQKPALAVGSLEKLRIVATERPNAEIDQIRGA